MGVKNEEAAELLSVEGRDVRVTHPDKLYFSRQVKLTKLDLVRYYLSVAPGALSSLRKNKKLDRREQPVKVVGSQARRLAFYGEEQKVAILRLAPDRDKWRAIDPRPRG